MKKKASTSFLKKRSKKLLLIEHAHVRTHTPREQKFFGSFFQKRTAFFLAFLLSGPAHAKDHVRVILDWFVNPNHAPLLVAQQIGAYAAEGLDVELVPPADPSLGPRLVAAGQADVALAAEPQFLEAQDAGLRLVRLGVLIDRPMSTLVVLKDSGITTLAGLRGKRIGAGSEVEQVMLGVMLQRAGVQPADVRMVQIGEQLSVALLSHQVDAVSVYRNFEPIELAEHGAATVGFDYEANGIPPFEDLMFAARPAVAGDTRLARFLRATTRGLAYLRAHPAESWEVVRKAYPDLDDTLNHAAWQATLPYFAHDAAQPDDGAYRRFNAFLKAHDL